MLQHWSLHSTPDRKQAEVCESAACSYARAIGNMCSAIGHWEVTVNLDKGQLVTVNINYLQGTLGRKHCEPRQQAATCGFFISTLHAYIAFSDIKNCNHSQFPLPPSTSVLSFKMKLAAAGNLTQKFLWRAVNAVL